MMQSERRSFRRFQPLGEQVEERFLLSAVLPPALRAALLTSAGFQPVRPNTPVLPFGATANVATFIDPTVHIVNGLHTVIGQSVYIGPFASINTASGFVKVGSGSDILDNATVIGNPNPIGARLAVFIGDSVSIGSGAMVLGPSSIGAYGTSARPTSIGPNSLIDGAVIDAGAIVSALARVGPGVTVPAGFRVLPGRSVTNNAEASIPALGKVVAVTKADQDQLAKILADNVALAGGYATLYQGNKATGSSPGLPVAATTVFNGNLAAVTGTSQEPGSPTVKFEPAAQGPQFPSPHQGLLEGLFPQFRARVIGQVIFRSKANLVASHLGRRTAIRGDEGQPITFASFPATGTAVSIHSPLIGQLTIGRNLKVGDGALILGGPLAHATDVVSIGDNVTIGSSAVVDRSSLGSGATIGARAYVASSKLPAHAVVLPGTILINNVVQGTIEW